MPTFGSLFAGIGGIDLGLERVGWECRWQVEIDGFRRALLTRHWPAVRREEDATTVAFGDLEAVDLIAGGFPCEDVSHAGRRAGIEGQQSGLWAQFARAVHDLRPRYVFVENVPGLLSGGMGRILGDLADLGYDAEWDCIPAAAVGAPHLRARIWILAYPCGDRVEADDTVFAGRSEFDLRPRWPTEPGVGRMVDGVSDGMDRLRVNAMGDAAVSQVVERIGEQMLAQKRGSAP